MPASSAPIAWDEGAGLCMVGRHFWQNDQPEPRSVILRRAPAPLLLGATPGWAPQVQLHRRGSSGGRAGEGERGWGGHIAAQVRDVRVGIEVGPRKGFLMKPGRGRLPAAPVRCRRHGHLHLQGPHTDPGIERPSSPDALRRTALELRCRSHVSIGPAAADVASLLLLWENPSGGNANSRIRLQWCTRIQPWRLLPAVAIAGAAEPLLLKAEIAVHAPSPSSGASGQCRKLQLMPPQAPHKDCATPKHKVD